MGHRRIGRAERVPFGYSRKMSDVLVDFARPLLDAVRTEDDFRAAITIAATGWNLSLLPKSEQSVAVERAMSPNAFKPGFGTPQEFERCLRTLVARKEALFPDDRRAILDYQVSGGPHDGYVTVKYQTIQTK